MSGPIPVIPGAAGAVTPGALPLNTSSPAGEVPFADLVSGLMQDASQQQAAVGEQVQQLITGESDSIHDVVLTASRADLAFRLVMEVRNRLISSYEEIMRMQI